MIDGQPVKIGDSVVCRDETSDAWWRASVRDIRGSDVLITFMGCDNAWDTWMESSSPDLQLMDAVEKKKDETAFQSDTYEESLTDDEMLETYRQQRWDDNARWQLTTFAQAHMGAWGGQVELYEPSEKGGMQRVVGPWATECTAEAKIVSNDAVEVGETLPPPASELQFDMRMDYEAFRPERGNMAVGAAFTLASPSKRECGGWLFEMTLREESRRVRCKLLYTAEGGEGAEGGSGAPAMTIASVAIVREVIGGGEFVDGNADDADIDGSPGRGLYDPPAGDKRSYMSLYSEGGITLVFPVTVESGDAGALSLDWIAGKMRYQIDRKFKKLDGSLSSLELTEIQKEDAKKFLPGTYG